MEIKKESWEKLLFIMNKFDKQGGFVHYINGELWLYDIDKMVNGVQGLYISKANVIKFINDSK